jgi:DNA-binding PadR family transcriptional regulator
MHRHEHGFGPDDDIGRLLRRKIKRRLLSEIERDEERDGRCGRGMSFGPRGFSFGPGGFHFEFGDGRGDRGFRGGGGGRGPRGRRMFVSGELRLVLLKLIADEPRHGYDLIRAIEELTGGDYAPSPGVVYPTLTMLQDIGLIEEQAAEGSRRLFAVTDAGRKDLADQEAVVEALFRRMEDAAPSREPGHPPIGRAIGNLMTALRHRVSHDGFDDALVHEITEILDDAAQRIERLK